MSKEPQSTAIKLVGLLLALGAICLIPFAVIAMTCNFIVETYHGFVVKIMERMKK